MLDDTRAEVISVLKRAVKTVEAGTDRGALPTGVEAVDGVLPEGGLSLGSLHEFSGEAATGFVLALLSMLGRDVLWCAGPRAASLYPPGLKRFGLEPDRLVVACPPKKQDALWIAEEAMKSGALGAVVLEADFTVSLAQSRRLQLAVEQSRCFGAVLYDGSLSSNTGASQSGTTAARTRWRVTPAPGAGIRWRLELQRNRDGAARIWEVSWHDTETEDDAAHRFALVSETRDRPSGAQDAA